MTRRPKPRQSSGRTSGRNTDERALRISLRLVFGDDIAIGPGKADLLELIRDSGSIAAAGRSMGMSYKRAWLLVATMNNCFKEPLVVASRGGRERGGAELTDTGEAVLSAYRRVIAGLESSGDVAAIRALLAPAGSPKTDMAEGK
jgi:molybdate transport system regulatory protein